MSLSVRWIILSLVLCTAAVVAWSFRSSGGPQIETISKIGHVGNGPAMCPWRNPERDMHAFFPGATGYRTDVFSLSRMRRDILRRLGSNTRLDSNILYVYRISGRSLPLGT